MKSHAHTLIRPTLDHQFAMPLILHGHDEATDTAEEAPKLDLNQHFFQQQTTTACAFARDDKLAKRGINCGDLLMVNRQLRPQHDDIILVMADGDMTCKILDLDNNTIHHDNHEEQPIPIAELDQLHVLGVITHSSRQFRN